MTKVSRKIAWKEWREFAVSRVPFIRAENTKNKKKKKIFQQSFLYFFIVVKV